MKLFVNSSRPSLPPVPSSGGNFAPSRPSTNTASSQASASSGNELRQRWSKNVFVSPFGLCLQTQRFQDFTCGLRFSAFERDAIAIRRQARNGALLRGGERLVVVLGEKATAAIPRRENWRGSVVADEEPHEGIWRRIGDLKSTVRSRSVAPRL